MKQPITSVWTREGRPARSTTLSRTQIVHAAVDLLDAEGMDSLSMRRLGARLGSGATSIYWHVANKDELLELVLDEVFGKVALPAPATTGWRDEASAFAYGLRAALLAHPWAVTLVGTGPTLGPNAMGLSARLLSTFGQAGFTATEQEYASSALLAYVLGVTTPEIAWSAAAAHSGMSDEELTASMKPVVEQAARNYPELAERYADYHGTGIDLQTARLLNFDFGLTCILDGLEARLSRQAQAAPHARPGAGGGGAG